MKRTRGFTLFEVIIAITIVVILLGTMASTMSLAFKSKRSAEDAVFSVRDIYVVGDVLVQELESAAPPNPKSNLDPLAAQFDQSADATGSINGTSSSVPMYLYGPFMGDQASIRFYATGPEPKATIQSDSRYVMFDLEQQPDGTMGLVRHVETNLLSADADPTQFPSETAGTLKPEVLMSNVQSIAFLYFDGTSWNTSWDSTQYAPATQLDNTLPYAVSIEITLNPLHEGGQTRVIKRFATLWCAEASVNAASTVAATSAAAELPGVTQ